MEETIAAQAAFVSALTEKYRENFTQYHHSAYNETEVRVDFVNPFFKALGWDMLNEGALPQHLREVRHEADVMVSENGALRKKKPDYSFRVGSETCFFLETKKPSVEIVTAREPAFQLRRYGWSGNLPVSVLTNFTDLLIYDCSVRPQPGDAPAAALAAHYHYTEYAAKFSEIYDLLSRRAVVSGAFHAAFGKISGALKKEPFDQYFLGQMRDWRNLFSRDLLDLNPGTESEVLNLFIQRMINRIIFLRICEDRGFEPFGSLGAAVGYAGLRSVFRAAERRYGSGLFDLEDDGGLILSDSAVSQVIGALYYPASSYEFSTVDPYIIGQIYEFFLDETVEIGPDGRLKLVPKPEAVDAQGAVNTPKNITDLIVRETLGPLCEGRPWEELSALRIADLCCGAGNFLLSAYEYLVNVRTDRLVRAGEEAALRRGDLFLTPGGRSFELAFAHKREILARNLFGVDWDPLAVEVARFSLLLKLLEGTFPEEMTAFTARTRGPALPDLAAGFKAGNSLLDSAYAAFDHQIYSKLELLAQLRMFDWEEEFGGQFDAVLCNPPYIRVQNMASYSPEEYAFYKSPLCPYESAGADLPDKYYFFLERGISLLKEHGAMGCIIPHRFMNIQSGGVLRDWLARSGTVKSIYHFGSHQVFPGRSTYTCVLILTKAPHDSFTLCQVRDWNLFLTGQPVPADTRPLSSLGKAPWVFLSDGVQSALDRTKDRCVPLEELADIFVGVQTSADPIYILKPDRQDEAYVYFHDRDGLPQQVEKALCKPGIYDQALCKYEKILPNASIIFPYQNVGGRPVLRTPEELETCFPCGFAYLSRFREELDRRNMPGRSPDTWFAYGRSQSIRRFSAGEHLIWPVLSLDANYVYDADTVTFTGGGNGPYYGLQLKAGVRESLLYLQAVLNHPLLEGLVQSQGSTFRGGYYSHGKQFVRRLPIRRIDFEDPMEAQTHSQVVEKVRSLMLLSARRDEQQLKSRKEVLNRAILAEKKELEQLIDTLYGVSPRKQVIE